MGEESAASPSVMFVMRPCIGSGEGTMALAQGGSGEGEKPWYPSIWCPRHTPRMGSEA
jgi:hypothetical protein